MAQALLCFLVAGCCNSQFKQSGAGFNLGYLGVSVPCVPCEPMHVGQLRGERTSAEHHELLRLI